MEHLYLDLLKNCLLDNIYKNQKILGRNSTIIGNVTSEQIENGSYWPERAHTMIGLKRLNNIQFCVESCIKNNIEGDLIETGVWRGGATIFMKGILKAYNNKNKKVYVADSFEGLPKPDVDKYPIDTGDNHHKIQLLSVSKEEVEDNFKAYDLLDDNVVFIKGFFETSLKNTNINKLALLRIDCDMYSSTMQMLEQLYDKVSIGGFIIVDDYALIGAKNAVDDFRKKRNITDKLQKIDWTGVFWQKSAV